MIERDRLIHEGLEASSALLRYRFDGLVRSIYPGKHVMQTEVSNFGLEIWSKRSGHELRILEAPRPEVRYAWHGKDHGVGGSFAQGIRQVDFEGETFDLVDLEIPGQFCAQSLRWWVGPSRAAVHRLAHQVAEVSNDVVGEVLVFDFGDWRHDAELLAAIRGSTFDSLILPTGMAERIKDDFTHFLSSRDEYARYGVPWKRGVLLLGPPGNGKTHCVKALINHLGIPCLYVKSLASRGMPAPFVVASIFERARAASPCALVLEDIDSLVTSELRSVFLNELDGFASNEGIITIGTANHPERLDPAILERPSRFDRKYVFELPAPAERARYLSWWRIRLAEEVPLGEAQIERLAEATEGFSFAYLKELVFSSLVAWVSEGRTRSLDAVLEAQVVALRSQMTQPVAEPVPEPSQPASLQMLMAMRGKARPTPP